METMASSKNSETEGVDVVSFMSNLSMSSSVSVTINDLSKEVLGKIIDRLGDRTSVLNCRLVNSKWNAAAGIAMENLCLSIWTRWNPRSTTMMREMPFPKTGSAPIFPFPTRSLSLDNDGWKEYKKTNKDAKIEMFQLLKLFGRHLTSLCLEKVSLDRFQISIIFKELVNLQALTISLPVPGTRKQDATAKMTANPPPNLQYLRLKWFGIDLAQWIVDQCSSQLISFETLRVRNFFSKSPRCFLKLPSSSSGVNHLGFNKLKLYGVSFHIFEQSVQLPLTHLSIDLLHDHILRPSTLMDIITFLNNFSGTLVHLYLSIFLGRREDGGIIPFNDYPRMTELFIWFLKPTEPDTNRLTYLHEVFLKRFPNLQRLHLLNCELIREERGMEQVKEELDSRFLIQHCFKLCQKLETRHCKPSTSS